MTLEDHGVFCLFCNEEFEYKMGFAVKHLKKYPLHSGFRTKQKKSNNISII